MRRRAIAIALTLALTGTVAHAGIVPDIMFDPSDGRFDTSRWLMQRNGFLPVPIVITEPAVGYGGGVGLLFFHDRDKPAPSETADVDTTAGSGSDEVARKPAPPSVSGVLAAATQNGTWFAGAGHLGIWKDDNIRSQTGAVAMEVHLDFYGGGELPQFPDGLGYSMKGWGVLENLMFRLKGSEYWAGIQALHLDADTHLESGASAPVIDQFQGKVTNTAVGAILERDTRDNIFSPNTGWDATARVRWHWGEFLGDFSYTEMDLKSRYYFTAGQGWHFAWKLDSSFTNGDVPFYALPAINLRGIAKQRYQGESVAMTEFEARYSIDERWSVLGFGGVGRASDKGSNLGNATDRFAGGAGFRYLLARLLGLQAGIDVAHGPEEWAFYLQVGSAWSL